MDKIVRFNILGRVTTSWKYSTFVFKFESESDDTLQKKTILPDLLKGSVDTPSTVSKP